MVVETNGNSLSLNVETVATIMICAQGRVQGNTELD